MTFELKIRVTYDPCGESEETLSRVLMEAAEYLASRGFLAGEDAGTVATVDRWTANVKRINP
ncbi:MAG TPA: hypothetical protein VIL45_07020 [Thermoplasmata archaeon]